VKRSQQRWKFGVALVVTSVMAVACRDQVPTAVHPPEPASAPRLDVISNTSALTMGWQSPFGTATEAVPHDQTLGPLVTICLWRNAACSGAPVAQFSVSSGLAPSSSSFNATWSLTAANMSLTRATYRIAVMLNERMVGLPILVEAMRGRWALAVPGQTPTLRAAASLAFGFRLGSPDAPPPPIATVVAGIGSATSQFLPVAAPDVPRSPAQAAALTTLGSSLNALQASLTVSPDAALAALTTARSAADAAVRAATPGDLADLDVIRLELFQVGLLLGVSG